MITVPMAFFIGLGLGIFLGLVILFVFVLWLGSHE